MAAKEQEASPTIIVTFRGAKEEQPLVAGTTVASIKERLVRKIAEDPSVGQLTSQDVKLMFKGKVLQNDVDLSTALPTMKKQKTYRLLASGVSRTEAEAANKAFQRGMATAPRVKDDLTRQGQSEIARRQRLGRQIMKKHGAATKQPSSQHGFGKIETLPNLPNRDKAHEILQTLANDPGVLACMAKHQWRVGSLAELPPEGKVGESEVCVMGLNRNKGQQILLRIRTDDLQGFRKMLSIRKVLFHELAHNVHSEHDGKFFQLMRQIEKEVNEMDWTQGAGLSSLDDESDDHGYEGGTFRLGGSQQQLSPRELAARAAMMRMTPQEEQEIQDGCGCGRSDLFLPAANTSLQEDPNNREPHDDGQDKDGDSHMQRS